MKALVFLGSIRTSSPPAPPRLGERVARCLASAAQARFDVETVDPLDYAFGPSFKPYFAYPRGRAPEAMEKLAARIAGADAYLMVSPEYNHAMGPALADLLNHFPSSLFSFKPSLIVTYSAGQWGGTRAAVQMRSFLSELGCLPVSAMVHVPRADHVLAADGSFEQADTAAEWQAYLGRALAQLAWWAQATTQMRATEDPFATSAAFTRSPSQRNAPP